MYIRSIHQEEDLRVLRQLIHDNPLGMLTTAVDSETYPLLQSSHIPFILDVKDESSETEMGILRGHMARQNPQSKSMIEALTAKPTEGNILERDVLVIFNGLHHHYVTPKFYVETKPSTAKVVPTWNYAAVQVYGRMKVFFDSKAEETSQFLQKQMEALSHHTETKTMGYVGGDAPEEWKVADAPEKYIEIMKKAVIGIEIEIHTMEGKFKMSQEMGKGDRDGVVKGFESLSSEMAKGVGKTVQQRGEQLDAKKAAA